MISTTQKRILRNFTSVVLSIILWYILSLIIHAPLILPYPHMVVKRLFILFAASSFWMAFLFTFLRVLLAFFLTLIAGFFLGLLSADFKIVKDLLTFPLSIIRTVPVISFILLAVFWFKSDFVPVFVAFIMALPVMLTACEKGFSMNKEVHEKLFKAECFGFTVFKAFCTSSSLFRSRIFFWIMLEGRSGFRSN